MRIQSRIDASRSKCALFPRTYRCARITVCREHLLTRVKRVRRAREFSGASVGTTMSHRLARARHQTLQTNRNAVDCIQMMLPLSDVWACCPDSVTCNSVSAMGGSACLLYTYTPLFRGGIGAERGVRIPPFSGRKPESCFPVRCDQQLRNRSNRSIRCRACSNDIAMISPPHTQPNNARDHNLLSTRA